MPFLRGKEIERKFGSVKDKVEVKALDNEYFDIERELAAVEAEAETLDDEYFQRKVLMAIQGLRQLNSHLDSIELALAR